MTSPPAASTEIGQHTHEAHIAAAVDQPDATAREFAPDILCGFGISRI